MTPHHAALSAMLGYLGTSGDLREMRRQSTDAPKVCQLQGLL